LGAAAIAASAGADAGEIGDNDWRIPELLRDSARR
jgi:hypothetical protein